MNRKNIANYGIVLAFLMLIAIGAIAYHHISQVTLENIQESSLNQVVRELEGLVSTLTGMENQHHHYVLTGDDRYLKAYNDGNATIFRRLKALKELAGSDRHYLQQLEVVESLVTGKLTGMNRAMRLKSLLNSDNVNNAEAMNQGRVLMEQIRQQVGEFRSEKLQMQQLLLEKTEQSNRHLLRAVIVGGVACFTLLILTFYMLKKEIAQRTAAEEKVEKDRDNLEQLVRKRTERLDEVNMSLIREVEKQRRAEEALQRYKLLSVHSSDIMLFIRCSDGLILEANAAAVKAYGYTAGELLGRTIFDLRNEEMQEVIQSQTFDGRGTGILFETVHRRKDGSTFPVEESSQGATIDDCRILISVIRDISERHQAEEARMLLASIIESSDDAIVSEDQDGIVMSWNRGAEKLFGYTAAEVMGRQIRDILPIVGDRQELELIDLVRRGEMVAHYETTRLRKDGTRVDLSLALSPIRGRGGKIVGASQIARDISDRKRKEVELIRAKREWERTFDSVVDLIAIIDDQHRIVRANRPLAERLGLPPRECVGLSCFQAVHGLDNHLDSCPHAMSVGNGLRNEVEIYEERLGGYFLITTTPLLDDDGKLVATVHVAHDITERKKAETELLQAQADQMRYLAQLKTIVDHLSEGLIVSDLDANLFFWNPAARLIHGFACAEECKRDLAELAKDFELSTPEDGVLPLEQWPLSRILNGETLLWWEVNVRRRDSDFQRCFSYRGTLARDAAGNPLMAVLTMTDVTDRKSVEQVLRDSESKLRQAESIAHLGHWRYNLSSKDVFWSEEVYNIFGANPLTVAPGFATVRHFVYPEDMGLIGCFADGVPDGDNSDFMFRIIRPDGVVRYLNCSAQMEYDATGAAVAMFGTMQDTTELRQKERELLLRNTELERFAYMISHDLKSPLVTVKAFLGFLEHDLMNADSEKIGADIHHIRTATDRMGMLLDEMLEMLRIGSIFNAPVHVTYRELVDAAVAMVAGGIAERGVEVRIKNEPVNLFGDRLRLEEIWQNLLENAVKFMGDQPSPRIDIDVRLSGRETVFYVRDNGIGIDQRYLERIFGMFDKLDENSSGSGMGLALVKRIVELYQGTIQVESAGIGHGACFRFTLPRAVIDPERVM